MRVAVAGASGRLGELICEVVVAHPNCDLVDRITSASTQGAGESADVLIDATTPEASPGLVRRALKRGQRVIVGTSGWSEEKIEELRAEMEQYPGASVIIVPNFSLGSVLGSALARIAGRFFDSIEIIETHHPHKIDSPSGTAIRTAEEIAQERIDHGIAPVQAPFAQQEARGQLVSGIPVHSLRLSGVAAKQEVRFGGVGETLTITHDTASNDAYRAGIHAALTAIETHEGLTVGLAEILGVGE